MLVIFAALLLLSVALTIYASQAFNVQKPKLTNGIAVDFSEDWDYGGESVSLPYVFASDKVYLSKDLPYNDTENAVSFRLAKTNVRVYADGEIIYENGFDNYRPFGNSEGYALHLIKIPAGCRTIAVYLQTTDGSEVQAPSVEYGTPTRLLWRFVLSKAPALVFFALGIVFSGVFLFVSINYGKADKNSNGWQYYLYLACFVLLSAWWVFTDSGVAQLLTCSAPAWYISCVYSFRLLPVPLILYTEIFCPNSRKQLNVLASVMLANVLLTFILQVTDTLDASQSLYITVGLMMAAMAVGVYCFVNEIIRFKNKELKGVLGGIIAVMIFAAFGFFDYYVLRLSLYSYAYMAAIIVFVVKFALMAYKRLLNTYRRGMKAELYKELAFTDILTGLKNRTAYESDIKQLKQRAWDYERIGIAVFDINGLKFVNDTMGHDAGDELIRRAADALTRAMESGEVYRIGGDEFAAIVLDKSREEIIEQAKSLQEGGQTEDGGACADLRMAFGVEVTEVRYGENVDIEAMFTAADDAMYENKKRVASRDGGSASEARSANVETDK
jgi:diguanylate cyclase (GGDEF)-like protein